MMILRTRKEQYLNEIVGNGNTAPGTPYTREELFFADILGEVNAPAPVTRIEIYLAKIANKYNRELPQPKTRIEKFIARAAGMDVIIPTPITREEMLWANYALITERELNGIPPLTFKAIAGVLKNYRIYGNTETKTRSYSGTAPLSFPIVDGSVSNYRIYGNTVNGESVGDRTENLFYKKIENANIASNDGCIYFTESFDLWIGKVKAGETYTSYNTNAIVGFFTDEPDYGAYTYDKSRITNATSVFTFTVPNGCSYVGVRILKNDPTAMLNVGSTALPYEPYGYRIPITNNSETANIYLDEPLRKVGDEAEYVDYAEQKRYNADGTSEDVSLPAFPAQSSTNSLSFGTAIQPSSVAVDVSEVVSCGDKVTDNQSVNYGKYKIPVTLTADSAETTDIYLDEPLAKSGNNADYIDYATQKRHNSDGTESSVTLPEIAVTAGTNTLTVGTEVQPSKVYLKGKIEEIPTRTVSYYSQDGSTLLGTETVESGGNASGLQDTPTKPDTEQYTYTFVGWSNTTNATTAMSGILNNITADKSVYAAFSETARTYTVYFYNGETLLETVTGVPSGGTATYTGATPTSSQAGYIFSGWSPSNTNITADTSCYAQFKEDEMYESITDTWSEIIANVSNGTYSTKYHIGDTKKIDLGTEGEVIMTIVGIDTDDLADNSGKAPITWISKQLLKTSHRMNPSNQSGTEGTGTLGGWEVCEMRSYLINTIKPLLPSEVRNALKTVKKYSRIYNTSEKAVNNVVSNDDIWIPSAYEMNFSDYETSGVTYSSMFPDNASRRKHKVGGSAAWWWLRSAGTANGFRVVHGGGSSYSQGADHSNGVAVGFVI